MKKQRGRPIMAAIFGFIAGFFASISLLAFGIIPLESPVAVALPFVLMVAAFVLAMWAPIGAKQQAPDPAPAHPTMPPAEAAPAVPPPSTPEPPSGDEGSRDEV